MEECAHGLQQQQDDSSHSHDDESIELLQMAREQYGTCRGFDSPLVERVNQTLRSLTMVATSAASAQEQGEYDDNSDIENDENAADLCLANGGWSNSVLLEIKTYEAPAHTDDWGVLAKRIKEYWSAVTVVQWSVVKASLATDENENNNNNTKSDDTNSYRLLDLAYGIQSLVLSCRIDQYIKTQEQVAQETEKPLMTKFNMWISL
jgi:hypothetical protein